VVGARHLGGNGKKHRERKGPKGLFFRKNSLQIWKKVAGLLQKGPLKRVGERRDGRPLAYRHTPFTTGDRRCPHPSLEKKKFYQWKGRICRREKGAVCHGGNGVPGPETELRRKGNVNYHFSGLQENAPLRKKKKSTYGRTLKQQREDGASSRGDGAV